MALCIVNAVTRRIDERTSLDVLYELRYPSIGKLGGGGGGNDPCWPLSGSACMWCNTTNWTTPPTGARREGLILHCLVHSGQSKRAVIGNSLVCSSQAPLQLANRRSTDHKTHPRKCRPTRSTGASVESVPMWWNWHNDEQRWWLHRSEGAAPIAHLP